MTRRGSRRVPRLYAQPAPWVVQHNGHPPAVRLDAFTVRAYPRRMAVKPGYRTSEFWTTLAVAIPLVLSIAGVHRFVSSWHGGVLLAVITAAYAVSRGMAKRPA